VQVILHDADHSLDNGTTHSELVDHYQRSQELFAVVVTRVDKLLLDFLQKMRKLHLRGIVQRLGNMTVVAEIARIASANIIRAIITPDFLPQFSIVETLTAFGVVLALLGGRPDAFDFLVVLNLQALDAFDEVLFAEIGKIQGRYYVDALDTD
jgi:hypothetical protein